MLKRFLSYYKPQMGLFVADTICALVLAAIDLAFPIILRNLCGGLFTQGQTAIMQALGMVAVGLVLMYATRCACRYFVSYWGHVMARAWSPRCARTCSISTSVLALRTLIATARVT